ncbi:hypothetical protein FDP41_011944 [Naegleria fowleri]|uniref:Prolyl 4-hydroxylase alpha subunit domain-containing protein n=1 Tax=Naegleria fowleri TaxID=5763 RepID=A0A6A5BVJ7_NAEFO|nr:uncharacterized protein FDP41_011944 [Naegleria fowleri]KAF0982083.1 hypothetical protein FDP41_011944 [Naegleria fowleri]CAG4707738.1 unnamed protein product [Naegleria fowleri]
MLSPTKKHKPTLSSDEENNSNAESSSDDQSLLTNSPSVNVIMEGLFTIDHVLSPLETQEYIRKAKEHTWSKSKVGLSISKSNVDYDSVRTSDQFEFEDEKLAQHVFKIGEKTLNDMFDGASAKFIPDCIDSNWKCYRYMKGNFFERHKDSGRSVNDLKSFVTVLIYLNGNEESDHQDFEGGQTLVYGPTCKEGVDIHPSPGKAAFFLHQLDHEAMEVLNGTKYILKSVVLFKKNDNYETTNSNASSIEISLKEDILLRVGDEEFKLTSDMLKDHPNCILNTMLASPMTNGIKNDPGSGLKLFEFPERNPQIFKTYVIPVLRNDILPNAIMDPSLKDSIDLEFKFWGLLPPFDPILTISSGHMHASNMLTSKELSSISLLLKSDLEEKLQMLEWRLQFLKILEKIKTKKEKFSPNLFEQDSLQEIMKANRGKFSQGSKISSEQYYFHQWIAPQIGTYLSNKYEVLPLKYHYDSNNFLIGQDRHLYELCVQAFGEQAISIRNIQFIHESHSIMESGSDLFNFELLSVTDEMLEKCKNTGFQLSFSASLEGQLDEGKFKTVSDILKHYEGVCIGMKYVDLLLHGEEEQHWEGEYNDEYVPNFSLFVLCVLVIDISKLK